MIDRLCAWWLDRQARKHATRPTPEVYVRRDPLPTAHPDRFTSLTPEERETWKDMEPWLKGL